MRGEGVSGVLTVERQSACGCKWHIVRGAPLKEGMGGGGEEVERKKKKRVKSIQHTDKFIIY